MRDSQACDGPPCSRPSSGVGSSSATLVRLRGRRSKRGSRSHLHVRRPSSRWPRIVERGPRCSRDHPRQEGAPRRRRGRERDPHARRANAARDSGAHARAGKARAARGHARWAARGRTSKRRRGQLLRRHIGGAAPRARGELFHVGQNHRQSKFFRQFVERAQISCKIGRRACDSASRSERIDAALTQPSAKGSALGPSRTTRSSPPRRYLLMNVLVRILKSHALRLVPGWTADALASP